MSRIKEFNLPDLGEGLTEGEILAWLVKVGDTIELNQPIVEVETAKAAVEIPAKWAGQVQAIFHPEGPRSRSARRSSPSTPIRAPARSSVDHRAPTRLPAPSAASLAAVEVAPAEGVVEPGRSVVRPRVGVPRCWSATARDDGRERRPRRAPARPAAGAAPAIAAADPAAPDRPAVPAPRPSRRTARRAGGPVLAKPPVRKLAKDLGVDLAALTGRGRRARSPGRTCSGRRAGPRRGRAAGGASPATAAATSARTGSSASRSGRPQAHRREHVPLGVHRAARDRVPDRRCDPVDEGPGPAEGPARLAGCTGLAPAARRQGGAARGRAAPDGQLHLGAATRSSSRITSTSASPRPPRGA